MSQQGYILTRQQKEQAGKVWLEFWLLTPDGPVCLTTPPQQPCFFIKAEHQSKVASTLQKAGLKVTLSALALRTFELEAVAACYFEDTASFYRGRDLLTERSIPHYESDIRLADRYLMERFVCAGAQFVGQPQSARHPYPVLQQAQMKPSAFRPEFRLLSVDIECSEHGELYSIGLAGAEYQCVLMIGRPQPGPEWIEWVTDEKALLQAFVRCVTEQDPDLFIGWNVINFDFRLLLKRAKLCGVRLSLGRDGSEAYWRDSRSDMNQGFVSMPGRLVIDGIDGLKTATYQFESFSLESVAQELLGKGKETEDVANRMAIINHDFRHNKVKLANYNLQDCLLVIEIFEHTRLLDFLSLRSQLTGLEMDRSGGSVAAFLNLYLPRLHRAGYISPNRPTDGGLASPGGYVMNSRPGLYEHVLVLDFKSLYPSIIRTFKVDPLGLVEGLQQESDTIEGFKGARFHREKHFLPDIITRLWQQRDEAKKAKDAARSQAIKILMNSFYGVLGSGGCPLYDTRLASSITMRGHQIMQTTAGWIEEAGYDVIYGDTDSTFVWLKGKRSVDEAMNIGKRLQQDINRKWQNLLAQDFGLQSHLEIEFETHFSRFLMPTIRGSEQGSKKRYAGLKTSSKGEELVFKGLESVRSDWTQIAKQFQLELYQRVFRQQPVEAYIQETIAALRAGQLDAQLIYRKRLRQPLSAYVKNVPPHVRAARLADEENARLGKALQYQRKGWVSYVITLNGPQPLEYVTSQLDYEHYVEKQIQPVAEAILPFVDLSFTTINSAQMGLFG